MGTLVELVDAFEWVSAAGPYENAAYVDRESGKIYWASDAGVLDEELDATGCATITRCAAATA